MEQVNIFLFFNIEYEEHCEIYFLYETTYQLKYNPKDVIVSNSTWWKFGMKCKIDRLLKTNYWTLYGGKDKLEGWRMDWHCYQQPSFIILSM